MERLGDEERLWEGLQEPSGRSSNSKLPTVVVRGWKAGSANRGEDPAAAMAASKEKERRSSGSNREVIWESWRGPLLLGWLGEGAVSGPRGAVLRDFDAEGQLVLSGHAGLLAGLDETPGRGGETRSPATWDAYCPAG